MNSRMRSPSYPSTPLEQAIEMTRKIHQVERTNSIDREVAAKALGYSGISGRSSTVLSNLNQYGLLEKAGKNEVRVTERAVEILYPDSDKTLSQALLDAAEEPELFQKVRERFTDGLPSANALEAFFIKLGFTDTAIPSAVRAFRETFEYLENLIEKESYIQPNGDQKNNQYNHNVEDIKLIEHNQQTPLGADNPNRFSGQGESAARESGPEIRLVDKKIWLGGVIRNRTEAEDLVASINALKPMLKDNNAEPQSQVQDVSEVIEKSAE